MTEAEWAACREPGAMLAWLCGPQYEEGWSRSRQAAVSERKLRLALAACCRRVWTSLGPAGRSAVEVAEAFADSDGGKRDYLEDVGVLAALEAAQADQFTPGNRANHAAAWLCGDLRQGGQVLRACEVAAGLEAVPYHVQMDAMQPGTDTAIVGAMNEKVFEAHAAERAAQAEVLRHCFAPWVLPEVRRAPDVLALAEALYAGDACSPFLRDALLEAGAHYQWTDHFTGAAHPRGCAYLDVLLKKE